MRAITAEDPKVGFVRNDIIPKNVFGEPILTPSGYLPKMEKRGRHAHHIDMDRSNNALGNIILLSSETHHELHKDLHRCLRQCIKKGIISFNRNTLTYEIQESP